MLKKNIKTLLYSVLLAIPIFGQGQTMKEDIAKAYEAFSQSSKLPNGMSSLTVLDGKTGQLIFGGNEAIGLPTASTMKVITSITALDLLGPDYRYTTKLAYTGDIDSLGTLHGDILIIGSGDPTLGSERYAETKAENILNKWVYSIRHAGINNIAGSVIADDRYLNGYDAPPTWTWEDMGNYYGAGISGLNWQENKVGIRFSATNVGKPTFISGTSDPLPGVHLINEVITGANGSGDQVYAFAAPYTNSIFLRGSYGRDLKKSVEIALPDPALALAQQLTDALADSHIQIDSIATTGKRLDYQGIAIAKPSQELDVHQSPTLAQIVYWLNKKSINLYAEALLKSFGMISQNTNSSEKSASLLGKYWGQKLHIANSELQIKDGSGLSPQNRVTTQAMAKIMYYAQSRPWFVDFQKSLPVINGTSMKSGTIGGVLGYTGYQSNKAGQDFVFSLLVNNYTGTASAMRQEMFKLLNSLK